MIFFYQRKVFQFQTTFINGEVQVHSQKINFAWIEIQNIFILVLLLDIVYYKLQTFICKNCMFK